MALEIKIILIFFSVITLESHPSTNEDQPRRHTPLEVLSYPKLKVHQNLSKISRDFLAFPACASKRVLQ